MSMAVNLIGKLLTTKPNGKIPLHINFYIDDPKPSALYYGLSYGSFAYHFREDDSGNFALGYYYGHIPSKQRRGIRVFIRDGDVDIKKWLDIVSCAYDMDTNTIKTTQHNYRIKDNFYAYNISSIPQKAIRSCMLKPDSSISMVMKERVYKNAHKEDSGYYKFSFDDKHGDELDYYFQNGRYHFYNNNSRYLEEKDRMVPDEGYGKVLFATDELYEIQGSKRDGFLVFTTDTSFYFLNHFMYVETPPSALKGPYIMNGNWAYGMRAIERYIREDNPDRFTLFLRGYRENGKVLFVPDSNVVITHYDSLEDHFISSIIHDRRNLSNPIHKRHVTSSKTSNNGIALLLAGLFVGINVGLLSTRFKSD